MEMVANNHVRSVLLILCLWLGAPAKGGTCDPVDGNAPRHDLLSLDRVFSAEANVRAKGYDVNDISKLRPAAADASLGVRQDALIVLTHRYGREAIPILTQALDDPWSLVRCTAARMLGALGDQTGLDRMRKDMVELAKPQQEGDSGNDRPPDKQVKGSVLRWKEGRPYDALEAAQVLAEFGDTSGYELAAHDALQSEYAAVRSFAVMVLADLSRIDQATLQAKDCDPEAVLLKVAESEVKPSVLGVVAGCVMGKMKPASQVRILDAIQRSPYFSELSELERQVMASNLARARKQLEQDKPLELAGCLPPQVNLLRLWMAGLPSESKSSAADADNIWTRRAERAAYEWVVKVINTRWLPPDVNVLRKDLLMVQNAIGPNDVTYSRWEVNGCVMQVAQTQTILLVQVHPNSAYMQPRLTTESRRALVMGMITRLVNRETDVVVTTPTSRTIERREIMPELLTASFDRGSTREYASGIHCRPGPLDSEGNENPKFWWQAVPWWTDGGDVSFCLLKTEGGQWAPSYNSRLDETWFEGPPSPSKRGQ